MKSSDGLSIDQFHVDKNNVMEVPMEWLFSLLCHRSRALLRWDRGISAQGRWEVSVSCDTWQMRPLPQHMGDRKCKHRMIHRTSAGHFCCSLMTRKSPRFGSVRSEKGHRPELKLRAVPLTAFSLPAQSFTDGSIWYKLGISVSGLSIGRNKLFEDISLDFRTLWQASFTIFRDFKDQTIDGLMDPRGGWKHQVLCLYIY